jgi:hypothetical protein
MNLPQNNSVSTLNYPKPVIKCTITWNASAVNDMLACSGSDSAGLINKWNVTLYNESSYSVPQVLGSTISGATFKYQNATLSNVIEYTAIVTYYTANGIFGTKTFQFPVQFKPGFESALDGFATFIILLIFVGFGVGLAQTQEGAVHSMSNTLFLMAFGVFICYMLSFSAGLGLLINSGVIVLLLAVGFYTQNQENKSQYYRG